MNPVLASLLSLLFSFMGIFRGPAAIVPMSVNIGGSHDAFAGTVTSYANCAAAGWGIDWKASTTSRPVRAATDYGGSFVELTEQQANKYRSDLVSVCTTEAGKGYCSYNIPLAPYAPVNVNFNVYAQIKTADGTNWAPFTNTPKVLKCSSTGMPPRPALISSSGVTSGVPTTTRSGSATFGSTKPLSDPDWAGDYVGISGYSVYYGSDPNGYSPLYYYGTSSTQLINSYSFTAPSEGTYYLRAAFWGRNGVNSPWQTVLTHTYDVTAPTAGYSTSPGYTLGNWSRVGVQFTPNCADSNSGISAQYISTYNGNWTSSLTLGGTTYIWVNCTDRANNNVTTYLGPFLFDNVAPTPNVSGGYFNVWHTSGEILTPTSTDSNSGIAYQYLSTDNVNWAPQLNFTGNTYTNVYLLAVDNAGNSYQSYYGLIAIDLNPPSFNFARSGNPASGSGWYNSTQTITPNSTDDFSGVAFQGVASWDGGGTESNYVSSFTANTTTNIYCYVRDWAGLTSHGYCGTLYIDEVAPGIGYTGAPSGTWLKTPVTISPAMSDSGGSGLSAQQYVSTYDGGWQSSFTLNTSAITTIYCYAADNAGNVTHGACGTIYMDVNPPSPGSGYNPSPSGWTNGSVNASISVGGDTGGSGSRGINCSTTPSVSMADTTAGSCSQTFNDNGILYYKTEDNALNWSTLGQTNITNIEKIPPTLGFSGASNGGTYTTAQTITPNSTDTISGIASQYVSNDNTNWVTSLVVSSSSAIYCKATDNAGNSASDLCGTITITGLPDWVVYDGDPNLKKWSWMSAAHEVKVTAIPSGTRVIYDYSNACVVSGHTTMAQQLYVSLNSWSGTGSIYFDWNYPSWSKATGILNPLDVIRMELQSLGTDLLYGFKGAYPTGPGSQSVPQAQFVNNGVIFAIEGQGSINPLSILKSVAIQCHASN